jgi:hypothetical protein
MGLHNWGYEYIGRDTRPTEFFPSQRRTCYNCKRVEEWNFGSNRTHGWSEV